MSKTFLAMLASLALIATLEVGYFVYLKNTITPTLPIKDASTDVHLALSPLKSSYDGFATDFFQKIAVHAVLELCTRCRYC